jgi:hypothetical protein
MSNVIVWDIETVPDLKGFAAANGHSGKSDEEIRAAMGDKFPKPFTTRLSASVPWLHTGTTAVPGRSMRLAHRMSGSAPRKRS